MIRTSADCCSPLPPCQVFGYLCIARLTTCYDRYWSGVTNVTDMYNKWLQSAAHAISFDRINDRSSDVSDEPYIAHLVQLYTQLSTLAMLKLHSGEPTKEEWMALGSSECQLVGERSPGGRHSMASSEDELDAPSPLAPRMTKKKSTASVTKSTLREGTRLARTLAKHANAPAPPENSLEHLESVEGLDLFSPAELTALMNAGDPVHLIAHRIHRCLTTRQLGHEGWRVPPPVYSRVYAELAEGMQSYNAALKLKRIAVPFGFVQLNAVLLLSAVLLTPISIACFSSTVSMSVFVSVLTVGGFVSMWLVANEMEVRRCMPHALAPHMHTAGSTPGPCRPSHAAQCDGLRVCAVALWVRAQLA